MLISIKNIPSIPFLLILSFSNILAEITENITFVAVIGEAIEAGIFSKVSQKKIIPIAMKNAAKNCILYLLVFLNMFLDSCFTGYFSYLRYAMLTGICAIARQNRSSLTDVLSIDDLDMVSENPTAIAPLVAHRIAFISAEFLILKLSLNDISNTPVMMRAMAGRISFGNDSLFNK